MVGSVTYWTGIFFWLGVGVVGVGALGRRVESGWRWLLVGS